MKLKLVWLCLLLINVVSCASTPSLVSSKKDPTKNMYVTEAFIYPEFRRIAMVEKQTTAASAVVTSGSRAPASER
nr:hypothetical protein BdHM001_09270 [Bdellovibrio sp. HM001]